MGGVDGWRRMGGLEWLLGMVASMDGVDGWRRWWTGVFDTESTDVEVPLSPVVRMTRTVVACSLSEQIAGCQWRLSIAL